jgi:cell division topological specificity factor
MGIFDYFRSPKPSTASIAKERLQVIVARERGRHSSNADYLPALHREILEVIRRYVQVDENAVQMKLDREGNCEILEVNITLPDKV